MAPHPVKLSGAIETKWSESVGGETGPIAEMADKVSRDVFTWFKWQRVPLPDQNFDCVKGKQHASHKGKKDKGDKKTHPVDIVFKYHDPYLNRIVYLNTDLKSYAKSSINAPAMYLALKSLANTIDCANVSSEWIGRYHLTDTPYEIRGMLFIYNHDAEYDKDFLRTLVTPVKARKNATKESPLKLEALPIQAGQSLHIVEPALINFLTTVVADAHRLHAEGTFPEQAYEFYYPDLKLHKTHGSPQDRPATVEMLAGPFLIIRHDKIVKYNEITGAIGERYGEGFVLYYNRRGSTAEEFVYLLDILSGYQILEGDHKLRIRLAHHSLSPDVHSNFQRAVSLYAQEWGFDAYKLSRLKQIEIEAVEITKTSFSRQEIAWER